jgi:hypothetical protein
MKTSPSISVFGWKEIARLYLMAPTARRVAWQYADITRQLNPSDAKKLQKIVLEAGVVNYTRPALAICSWRVAANVSGPGVKICGCM